MGKIGRERYKLDRFALLSSSAVINYDERSNVGYLFKNLKPMAAISIACYRHIYMIFDVRSTYSHIYDIFCLHQKRLKKNGQKVYNHAKFELQQHIRCFCTIWHKIVLVY
ncbi:hypothetical protein LOAG_00904 [Loa loa]|uniref:Uncharacterized protein n=1 Tax=Loa loa TaxID=7209 RepID=A0A1S0UCB5_LOALO|nr:hypothetical protein LOAG_00904 [Loa loa]EFO27585.1 hypothetical protein LOAG_00904 [Loa loa]